MSAAQDGVREGLARVLADTPVRSGYLEAMGGYSSQGGPFARGEVGVKPWQNHAFFLEAEWNQADPRVGAGWRWEWDF